MTSAPINPSSVVNPLCIILVKNGSKGDRLLFRYPYKNAPIIDAGGSSVSNATPQNDILGGTTTNTTPTTTTLSLPLVEQPIQPKTRHRQPKSKTINALLRYRPDFNATSPTHAISVSSNTNSTPTTTTTADTDTVVVESPTAPSPFSSMDNQQQQQSVLSPSREGRSGSLNARPVRKTSRTSPAGLLFSNSTARQRSQTNSLDKSNTTSSSDVFIDEEAVALNCMDKFSPADGAKMLSELSDKDLSNLLAVSSDLSERKFELKLNYVRFVGHPTLMQNPKLYNRNLNHGLQTSVKLFHVVFCLNAVATHSIVKCFHDLSKRLGIALRHEEYRCSFLAEEFKKIVAIHDEMCTEQSDDKDAEERVQHKMFDDILSKSKLARLMKHVYNDVIEKGRTFVRVNGWVQISFCLPQKIHTLKFREGQTPLVEPEAIHKCLEAIRPYHAILLLVSTDDLNDTLWLDASSTISRLLQVYSPLKSLQTLAADADLTLSQTVEIASHLVYWAQATVIYPLCESNVYVVAPDIPITSPGFTKEFKERFPGVSLAQTLADFSLPMPLGERINPVLGGNFVQAQQVSLVTWMLKCHLLIHIHTYVYLTTYFDGTLMDSGADYLAAFTGNLNGSGNYSLNIRPFEADEDEATASDSFSETALDDVNNINSEPSGGEKDEKRPDSMPATPNTTTSEHVVNSSIPLGNAFPELNEAVRRAVSLVKSPLTMQDIRMFSRLSKYFTGDFHVEEIMYRENVRRSQLMLLLDKFRDVLITIEKEDAEINFFPFS